MILHVTFLNKTAAVNVGTLQSLAINTKEKRNLNEVGYVVHLETLDAKIEDLYVPLYVAVFSEFFPCGIVTDVCYISYVDMIPLIEIFSLDKPFRRM